MEPLFSFTGKKMSLPFPDTHTYTDAKDPSVKVSYDNRFFPIVIAKPHKSWTDDSVRYFFTTWRQGLVDYAVQHKTAIVVIFDMRTSTVPAATTRKIAGDYAAGDKGTKGLLRTFMVVDNPMLRGVITAIIWLAGDVPVAFVGNFADAIKSALHELEKNGIPAPPIDAERYTFPITI